MITVFTPTFNRAYALPKLYESLCYQTSNQFEWVIVDDGSTDNTKEIVSNWINEGKIDIRYIYQPNAGKPAAHNRGVVEAKGDMFVCVDSDDCLVPDAITSILNCINIIQSKKDLVGILAFRMHTDNTPITRITDNSVKACTLSGAYKKHGLSGDTMLIFKTDVVRKFEFPIVAGEKFIPEGYLYNKIDKIGKLFILRKYLYVCEYLDDGYTKNVSKLIFNNYKSYVIHINVRLKEIDKGFDKLFDSIRYDSVMIAHHEKGVIKHAIYPFLAVIGYVPGLFLAYKRYREFMK